jgi:hypothetical protein
MRDVADCWEPTPAWSFSVGSLRVASERDTSKPQDGLGKTWFGFGLLSDPFFD